MDDSTETFHNAIAKPLDVDYDSFGRGYKSN